jgi:thymidylate synthase (FAD)
MKDMSKVTLVHSTKDGDELIAYMARVSNPTNQSNPNSSKLIKYLISHKHWSPFEMVNMCVEINTTRSISAQILKDPRNRQNSIDDPTSIDTMNIQEIIKTNYIHTFKLYQNMLAAGIAKECAREVLPMGSPTRLYMNGTLRSWIHYVDLRTANGTQKEHMDIAEACKQLIKTQFPSTYNAIYEVIS